MTHIGLLIGLKLGEGIEPSRIGKYRIPHQFDRGHHPRVEELAGEDPGKGAPQQLMVTLPVAIHGEQTLHYRAGGQRSTGGLIHHQVDQPVTVATAAEVAEGLIQIPGNQLEAPVNLVQIVVVTVAGIGVQVHQQGVERNVAQHFIDQQHLFKLLIRALGEHLHQPQEGAVIAAVLVGLQLNPLVGLEAVTTPGQ